MLWVLEPDRLGVIMGPKALRRRVGGESQMLKGASPALRDVAVGDKALRRVQSLKQRIAGDDIIFDRARLFANYIVNQVTFFAQMCRGRCYNVIYNLEKELSYDVLLNMATNPWLPFSFRAEVTHLLVVMYVDRFPQQPNCGAPHLPEQTWIYDAGGTDQSKNKSTMPVVNPSLTLKDTSAFPDFTVLSSSSAYGLRDPVIGMGQSTKFFLLERLCIDGLTTTSNGRVVHADGDEVRFSGAGN